jgi:hypothetical protein
MYLFAGVDDHVVLPPSVILRNGTATFCAFVKYFDNSGSLANSARIFDFGNGNRDNIFMGNTLTSRDLRFEIRNGSADPNPLNAPLALTPAAGYWAHVCTSVDAVGSKRAYVNGLLVGGPTAPQPTTLSTIVRTTNYFGRSNSGISAYFRGE